ncbi:MAG: hypothetical protein ABIO70_36640 [Pseudomonadota bacterium]
MERRSLFALAAAVLARPHDLLTSADDPQALGRLAGPLLGLTALGAGLFGLVVGSFDGGWQLLWAALKMPLVLLVPVVITVPALRALHASDGPPVSLPRTGLAALVGSARVAILTTALAPLLWLVYSLQPPYTLALLLMAGGLSLCGLPGLVFVGRALRPAGRGSFGAVAATVLLVGVVIAQTGWLLRPFVVTPGAQLTVLCPRSGDVLSGLLQRLRGRVSVDEAGIPTDCAVPPRTRVL